VRTEGFVFIFASLSLLGNQAYAACGDLQKNSEVYKAFSACEQIRAVRKPIATPAVIRSLNQADYCILTATSPGAENEELAALCKDPEGFACSNRGGHLFDSRCDFNLLRSQDISDLPDFVEENCASLSAKEQFLKSHRSECGVMHLMDCDSWLTAKHISEIALMEIQKVYTPERLARIQKLYAQVKNKYLQAIESSQVIPKSMKPMLMDRIAKTELKVSPTDLAHELCAINGPSGPDSGIFNDRSFGIHFCLGAAATLDWQNTVDLEETLGHELSHSIDPCGLESAQYDPQAALRAYPGLLTCLRGGTGDDGCTNPVIHCTTDAAIAEFCDASDSSCIGTARRTPSCDIGNRVLISDLSQYKATGAPLSQINESFADFMGAEVVGKLNQAQPLDLQDRIDALASIAADFSNLHGHCLTTNTADEHPIGSIRVNRMIMGSRNFRAVIGCSNPPQTPQARLTCHGF
jgi:hypothetical protein